MDGFIFRGIFCALLFWSISEASKSRNFILIPNQRLGIHDQMKGVLLKEKRVANQLMCGQWCLRTSSCFSFNLEKESASNTRNRTCELLSVVLSDVEIKQPDYFQEDQGFDFYISPEERCQDSSCHNQGRCLGSLSSFYCSCINGYEGVRCETRAPECINYNNLTEADRNIKYGVDIKTFDGSDVITTGQWYRITGPAGSRMLDYCPTSGACNADFSGWIDSQPNPGEVRVQRRVQKRHLARCDYYPQTVLTTNCGDFNVYQLKRLNMYVRYCGTD